MIRRDNIKSEDLLKEAAVNGDTDGLINLLENGAPFIVDTVGQTVLHVAVSAGKTETVTALLDRGCDSNVLDFTGRTALQLAAGGGYLDIVKLLLKAGATVDHQDEVERNTALHEASQRGFSQTLSLLCKNKANVYMKNRGGFAPLHLCCQNGHNESSRVLLTQGCRPDLKNNFGDTPLHTAARYGHAGVTRILISAKCKISQQNKNGDTALHIAAAMGRRKLTQILVEAKIDKGLRNNQGETASDIAVRKQLQDVVNIIGSAGFDGPIRNIISDLDPKIRRSNRRKVEKEYKCSDTGYSDFLKKCQPRLGPQKSSKSSSRESSNVTSEKREISDKRKRHSNRRREANKVCDCNPLLEKICEKIQNDRLEIVDHIEKANTKISTRLEGLEKRTKADVKTFHEAMKECFAEERTNCQDRVDRQSFKDKVDFEKGQSHRDIILRSDISRWLQAMISDIERKDMDVQGENKAVMRKIMRKKSTRETKAIWSEIRNGTLRRSNSLELMTDICDDVLSDHNEAEIQKPSEENCKIIHGLRISNKPLTQKPKDGVSKPRVRHNSEGNYDDVSVMQETMLQAAGQSGIHDTDNVYENVTFFNGTVKFQGNGKYDESIKTGHHFNNAKDKISSPPLRKAANHSPLEVSICSQQSIPYYEHISSMTTGLQSYRSENLDEDSHCSLGSVNLVGLPLASTESSSHSIVGLPVTSECGSVDSHNDSGYSTRLGISEGPSSSPELTDSEPVLDPAAIQMVPSDWESPMVSTKSLSVTSEHLFHNYRPSNNRESYLTDRVIISASSLV